MDIQDRMNDQPDQQDGTEILFKTLRSQYNETGSIEALGTLISVVKQILQNQRLTLLQRANWLQECGHALSERFSQIRAPDDIDEAISRFGETLELLGHDHDDEFDRPRLLCAFGKALLNRFEQRKTIADIDRAVDLMKESSITTTSKGDQSYRLQDLGRTLYARFQISRSLNDLNEARSVYDQALRSIHNIDRAEVLNDLSNVLEARYDITKCLDDLYELVDVKRDCVYCLANGYYDQGVYWDDFSSVLQILFDWTGGLDNINEAIDASTEAVDLAYDNTDSALYLENLSCALQRKARRTWAINEFEGAVRASADALNTAPPDHPNRASFWRTHGDALEARFSRLGNFGDINRAVDAYKMALDFPGGCSSHPALSLHGYGTALLARYSNEGPLTDLEQAIANLDQAVRFSDAHIHKQTLAVALLTRSDRLGNEKDLERAMGLAKLLVDNRAESCSRTTARNLNTLALAQHQRFQRTTSTVDLDEEIESLTKAIQLAEDYPESTEYRTNLGNALQMRILIRGKVDGLRQIVELRKYIVDVTPEDDPRASGHMLNLANALEFRFWETGSMTDLNDTITINQRIMSSLGPQDPNRALFSHNLGRCLENRYRRMGSLHDLNSAIAAIEAAVNAASEDGSRLAMYLGALGVALQLRSRHPGYAHDVSNGIVACRKSVERTTDKFVGRSVRLVNLGQALKRQYERTGCVVDLNEAVSCFQQALGCDPPNSTRRYRSLHSLARSLHERFLLTGSMRDLQGRFHHLEKVVELLPKGHPDRALSLVELIDAVQQMFGEEDTRDMRSHMAEEAASEKSASIQDQIEAALCAGRVYMAFGNLERASYFYSFAVGLLPEVSPRTLARVDQQRKLGMYSHIASTASAMVLNVSGNPLEALRLLEIGRGVLASLQLDTRTDITDLEAAHPQLAHEFKCVQDQLDSELQLETDFTDMETAIKVTAQVSCRHNSVTRMSSLLQEIRSLHGFDRFLTGPANTELLALASNGPIVVFNVSETRCDALIITMNETKCLPLPDLRKNDIAEYAQELMTRLHTLTLFTYCTTNKLLEEILEWLWDVAVGPVLHSLGLVNLHAGDGSWRHIWWVGSGWLNVLPLHAAGYKNDPTRSTMDRVVSGYVPTIRALSVARTKAVEARPKSPRALLVSMPRTPGDMEDLAHATAEISEIGSILPNAIPRSTLQEPAKAEVKQKMKGCHIVHFACHASSNPREPSQSHLLLTDWQDDIFSVTDIIALRVTGPSLIYLSACHAAQARAERLLDEGIHLAGACQLAGFSHVIATLWTINDSKSVKVAKDFYSGILQSDELEFGKAAESLHHAVRRLRDDIKETEMLDDFLQWVPYVYFGA